MNQYKINFDQYKEFKPKNINLLIGLRGLYFISLKKTEIPYPFRKSRLIYGLINYRKVEGLYFTYLNFEMLKKIWNYRIEDLESYFILDFVNNYGIYPICNNKSGFEVLKKDLNLNFKIDWKYFEKGDLKNG